MSLKVIVSRSQLPKSGKDDRLLYCEQTFITNMTVDAAIRVNNRMDELRRIHPELAGVNLQVDSSLALGTDGDSSLRVEFAQVTNTWMQAC